MCAASCSSPPLQAAPPGNECSNDPEDSDDFEVAFPLPGAEKLRATHNVAQQVC